MTSPVLAARFACCSNKLASWLGRLLVARPYAGSAWSSSDCITLQFRGGGKLSIPALLLLLSPGADEIIRKRSQDLSQLGSVETNKLVGGDYLPFAFELRGGKTQLGPKTSPGGDAVRKSPELLAQSARPWLAIRWGSRKREADLAGCSRSIRPRFRLPSVEHPHPFSVGGTGDAFFNAFVPAAKAPIGRAYEEGGHAQRHQSLAVGIGADALGGLCQLAELPDALRSGTRLRMCTVHDGEPELGRLPLLRKSLPASTAHTVIETCGCDSCFDLDRRK
jgi:hypothetical protein